MRRGQGLSTERRNDTMTLYTTHPLFWIAVLIVIGILWGR